MTAGGGAPAFFVDGSVGGRGGEQLRAMSMGDWHGPAPNTVWGIARGMEVHDVAETNPQAHLAALTRSIAHAAASPGPTGGGGGVAGEPSPLAAGDAGDAGAAGAAGATLGSRSASASSTGAAAMVKAGSLAVYGGAAVAAEMAMRLAATICYVCGSGDNDEMLLMCENDAAGCTRAAHTYCVGLDAVPEGEWFCGKCAAEKGQEVPGAGAATTAAATTAAASDVPGATTTEDASPLGAPSTVAAAGVAGGPVGKSATSHGVPASSKSQPSSPSSSPSLPLAKEGSGRTSPGQDKEEDQASERDEEKDGDENDDDDDDDNEEEEQDEDDDDDDDDEAEHQAWRPALVTSSSCLLLHLYTLDRALRYDNIPEQKQP